MSHLLPFWTQFGIQWVHVRFERTYGPAGEQKVVQKHQRVEECGQGGNTRWANFKQETSYPSRTLFSQYQKWYTVDDSGIMKKKHMGSTFDSWLREEGIYEEVSAAAIKRVLSRQLDAAIREKGLSKAEVARRMGTSRAALDRLLDPENGSVTLSTLRKAATVVGREVRLELV
jgi:antitoxin HicB